VHEAGTVGEVSDLLLEVEVPAVERIACVVAQRGPPLDVVSMGQVEPDRSGEVLGPAPFRPLQSVLAHGAGISRWPVAMR
jgi:hypothetical protein